MAKRPPHTRPSTVAEAVAILLNTLGPERLERIRRMRREDLVELRFSLGSYILTEFGLRENNQTLLTACQVSDPGEAQAVILEALWTDLHPAGPPPDPPPPARIISDGQPGAARGALDFAISRRIPHGGWCPRRHKAARGPILTTYDLRETPTKNLSQSIAWNIRDSDATLVVTPEKYLVGASRKAINLARDAGKPVIHLHPRSGPPAPEIQLLAFIQTNHVRTLNVAGSATTLWPNEPRCARQLLDNAWPRYHPPLEPPDTHVINAAEGWCGLGNYIEASAELKQLTPDFQLHPDALEAQASIYFHNRQWAGLIQVADTLVKQRPDSPASWLYLAAANIGYGPRSYLQARQILLKALARFPGNDAVLYELARVSCLLDLPDDASEWLAHAARCGDPGLNTRALADPDFKPLWPNLET